MKNILSDISLGEKGNLARLITGAVIFAFGIVLEYAVSLNVQFKLPFIFIAAYAILGFDIILRSAGNIIKGQVFDENFLMSIATIGAFLIGEAPEAAGVMLFYQTGEYFQELAVKKSKKSITDLMDIRPDYANLFRNGGFEKVSPESAIIGDIIIVKPGEKIPLDGNVIEGNSMIDTSALTGESVPRKAAASSDVLSGCVNLNGVLTIKVTKTYQESAVSKIISLVENSADKKAKTENFITKFARVYTPVVVILAVLLAAIAPVFFGGDLKDWVHRALVFLVISCPCALVLSIPMGFFAGIGRAAKSGILVKGGNYLEAFNNLETIVFDKTGTLTKGVFKVTEINAASGFSEDEVLHLASRAESYSNHPIALSVINEYKLRRGVSDKKNNFLFDNENFKIDDYAEIAGRGVSVSLNGEKILAGNSTLMKENNIIFTESKSFGTKVYVAKENVYAGCVIISDEIKEDSKAAITSLKKKGARKTVMLTGDTEEIARNVAGVLGLDEVYSGLLPHEKAEILEKLLNGKSAKGKLAFAGDGINDAPSLAIADIGIAMGALGSDAAIEAADVVLMTDEPSRISRAMDIAKLTAKIVRQNIIFTLFVKAVFLSLGAFGIASMWEAVFADVGVSLLAVLNAMRILNAKIND